MRSMSARLVLAILLILLLSTTSCARSTSPRDPKVFNQAKQTPLAGRAFYSSLAQAGYAEPTTFSISADSVAKGETLTLSVKEDYIYKYYYIAINGQWQKQTFSQATTTNFNWIKSSASASLDTSKLTEGSNYVVVYSCTKAGSTWDCHNHKWQIHEFKILSRSIVPHSEPPCGSDQECPINYVCITQECVPKSVEPSPLPETEPFMSFPLLMINLHPADLPAVKDFIDVGMYYTTFAPFKNAADPLRVKRAVEMIDAAKANGLKVIISIGDITHPYTTDPTKSDQWLKDNYPELIGDGIRKPVLDANGQIVKYDFYDPSGAIKLASNIDEISADYINYWTAQNEKFIDYLVKYDTSNTIYGWYCSEEVRYWYNPIGEYGLEVACRNTINKMDSKKRPLLGSTQYSWDAEVTIPYTLLETGSDATFSTTPSTSVTLTRDQNKLLKQLQDHVLQSNYLGLALGSYGSTNRIASYHTIQKGLKAIEYVKKIYQENNQLTGNTQKAPEHKIFHLPDLSQDGPKFMTTEHARHDFWSGVLDANGILIYNYFFHDTYPQVWNMYKEGMTLIKQEGLRQYLTSGVKTTPTVTVSGGKSIIPGNDYLVNGGLSGSHYTLPDYNAVNARLFRIGEVGYLIVSHSYKQNIGISIDLQNSVSSAQVVVGNSNSLVKTNTGITDSFSGIDARVYKITFTS